MILAIHFAVRCLSIRYVPTKCIVELIEVEFFATCVFKVVDLAALIGDEMLDSVVHLLIGKCARKIDEERLELRTEPAFCRLEELSLNFGL